MNSFQIDFLKDQVIDSYIKKFQIKEDRITVKRVELALEPRIGHTSHVLNNYLILVGGVGIRNSPGIYYWHKPRLSWWEELGLEILQVFITGTNLDYPGGRSWD